MDQLHTLGNLGAQTDLIVQHPARRRDLQHTRVVEGEVSRIEVTAEGSGTVSFDWGVDSEGGYDYLEFYIDGWLKDRISGYISSQSKSYSVGSGTHLLLWKYTKDGSVDGGSDQGWVNNLQAPGSEEPGGDPAAPEPPGDYSEAVDSTLKFTSSGDSTWSTSASSWEA